MPHGNVPCAAPATFVLVHGAWRGGWCWVRLADRLRGLGHRVLLPTLTGLGERSHLLTHAIDLTTHVTDIVNLIRWRRLCRVVLVGHSYGGAVISMVVERVPEAVGSMVFLDAFVPDDGDNVAGLASRGMQAAIEAAAREEALALAPPPAAFFAVNEADRHWVDDLCTPHPLAALTQPVVLSGARERIGRKTYIRATGFASPSFDAAATRLRHDPSWRVLEIGCGHDVMIDMPDALTGLLLDAA